jgi:hypothetical protein
MANREIDELVRAVIGRETSNEKLPLERTAGLPLEQVVRQVLPNSRVASATAVEQPSNQVRESPQLTLPTEMDRLSEQMDQLRQVALTQADRLRENTSAISSVPRQATEKVSSGASLGSTVARTVGTTLGISPIITGLTKLFGLFNKPEPLPELTPLVMPKSLRLEAGLEAKSQDFVPISYSAEGKVRSAEPMRAPSATIQIQVNAMDSKSFMDHSDDIARAVKEAMLHSHSLNDVVNEL